MIDKVNYCVASDVFSFGNAMYEILNLKHIFSSWTVKQVWEKVLKGERPKFNKKSENKIEYIIEMCWKADPKDRPSFKTISQLLFKEAQELEALENQQPRDSASQEQTEDCVDFE